MQLRAPRHRHCQRVVFRGGAGHVCVYLLCRALGPPLALLRRGLGTALGTESTVTMPHPWRMEQGVAAGWAVPYPVRSGGEWDQAAVPLPAALSQPAA